MRQANFGIGPSTIDDSTTMAPNLAVSTHELTQNIIGSKLRDDQGPTDDQTANIARCSTRAIRPADRTSSSSDQRKPH